MRLKIAVTNRCNFMCDYCVVRVNQDAPLFLEASQLREGIDQYLDGVDDFDPNGKGIGYGGGEPLLKPAVVSAAVAHARRRSPDLRQDLHTNGAMLTPSLLAFLRDHSVRVVVSLDGDADTNDRHRVGHGDTSPTWALVRARLEDLPLPELGVNMVFTPKTVGRLAENVEFMNRLGFRTISFDPDTCHPGRLSGWNATALKRLSLSARKLAANLQSWIDAGPLRSEFSILSSNRDGGTAKGTCCGTDWRRIEAIVLGADGNYYPNSPSGLLDAPYEALAQFRCGSIRKGINWEKLRALEEEVNAFIKLRFGPRADLPFSPIGEYLYAKRTGENAEKLIRLHMKIYDALLGPFRTIGELRSL